MRHRTAARKGDVGGWHYVDIGRDGGHPIGHCADHDPHPTESDARQCYARYQRDNIVLDATLGSWTSCAICGAPTKTAAKIRYNGFNIAPLCVDHLSTEHAAAALGLGDTAGDSWQS